MFNFFLFYFLAQTRSCLTVTYFFLLLFFSFLFFFFRLVYLVVVDVVDGVDGYFVSLSIIRFILFFRFVCFTLLRFFFFFGLFMWCAYDEIHFVTVHVFLLLLKICILFSFSLYAAKLYCDNKRTEYITNTFTTFWIH